MTYSNRQINICPVYFVTDKVNTVLVGIVHLVFKLLTRK